MRLSCPNCGAQYEVPVEVIPQDGRDVQCSSCGHTWFQMHPDQDVEMASDVGGSLPDEGWDPNEDADVAEEPGQEEQNREVQPPEPEFDAEPEEDLADSLEETAPEAEDYAPVSDAELEEYPEPEDEPDLAEEPEPEDDPELEDDPVADAPSGERQQRKAIDPAIADVLRQEAEYESQAREAENRETLETQTELGLEEPGPQIDKRASEARERMRRIRGLAEIDDGNSADEPETASEAALEEAAHASRRDLLPDIDEINSTLRSADGRDASDGSVVAVAARQRKRSGFRLGFGFVMLFAALVIMAYVYNKEIIAAYPASEPYVVSFMETMNDVRVWLDTQVTSAMLWLDNIAGSAGGNVK
ncbi:zinc-ribbon domain-containing protein [Shimia sediminis]|uniref:zinc-ribbon domain-containing protein n=1 Tax=Shimia sediminis TaxID=2497945 RepID=UPI0013DFF18B|nr:zinc-ribbon domain-containing protein [Shimia sediminis]